LIKLHETEDFVIYDDVLPPDQFAAVWAAVQHEEYLMPHISGWSKVWRLSDGVCLGGRDYDTSKGVPEGYVSLMNSMFTNVANAHPAIVPGWDRLNIRSYLYPRGTKLSWHNDLGYAGAVIFYAHPEWASTWGGELMIARTPPCAAVPPPHLDHKEEDKFLGAYGTGTYITCKPNRLVLTRAGVWHSINRVDEDAGDHCRASVVGFFKEGPA
jgi:hypothetical protein